MKRAGAAGMVWTVPNRLNPMQKWPPPIPGRIFVTIKNLRQGPTCNFFILRSLFTETSESTTYGFFPRFLGGKRRHRRRGQAASTQAHFPASSGTAFDYEGWRELFRNRGGVFCGEGRPAAGPGSSKASSPTAPGCNIAAIMVTGVWSILWSGGWRLWKPFRLFLTSSFWRPPTGRRAGQKGIVPRWCAMRCGSICGDWRRWPWRSVTALATLRRGRR